MADDVAMTADVDVSEEREGFDDAVLVHDIVSHGHLAPEDDSSFDTTEVDGQGLRVLLADIGDREAVDCSRCTSVPSHTARAAAEKL